MHFCCDIQALTNGDMHTHLQHTKFAIPQVVQFTAHAVLAIDAMHQAGRVHSDMKPANMMLNSEVAFITVHTVHIALRMHALQLALSHHCCV
jgi:serine/threonine protein kinase